MLCKFARKRYLEEKYEQQIYTAFIRFWQLFGATEKLPKPDNERKIAKNLKTNFVD
jgi:hypothetical protein